MLQKDSSNQAIREIVKQEVGASAAHHFGLIQEWMADQFGLMFEKFEILEEKMDRGFFELRGDIDHSKRNIDTNSLDILNLKNRVTRLEKTYD